MLKTWNHFATIGKGHCQTATRSVFRKFSLFLSLLSFSPSLLLSFSPSLSLSLSVFLSFSIFFSLFIFIFKYLFISFNLFLSRLSLFLYFLFLSFFLSFSSLSLSVRSQASASSRKALRTTLGMRCFGRMGFILSLLAPPRVQRVFSFAASS